ncbi:ATPase family protein associated with various cellular activities (AAA) [Paraburkholderia unamae]|nr:ATPase family protein associated with various cellular activities (AAA) [Paraburkholderia unamae]
MPKPVVPWSSAIGAMSDAQRRESRVEPPHDLEAHMDDLRALDKIRKASAEMRNKGRKALSVLEPPAKQRYEVWKCARVRLQYARNRKEVEVSVANIEDRVKDVSIEELKEEYAPVLAAAEGMRMCIATGHLATSGATMRSWYWVVREIFTAAEPDWCIGGARGGDDGWVTAYSTCQCVRALCDLAKVLEQTADLLEYLDRTNAYLGTLAYPGIPEAWRELDKARLLRELETELSLAEHNVVFNITPLIGRRFNLDTLTQEFHGIVKSSLEALAENLKIVAEELPTHAPNEGDWPSQTGHAFALNAIGRGRALTQDAHKKFVGPDWMKEVAKLFRDAAEGVRHSMGASKRYLSSVIDTQLAAANHTDTRTWEPGEVAYAAPAYALTLGKKPESSELERLKLAAGLICSDLSADGTLTGLIPFHEHKECMYTVHTEEQLGAVAELIRVAHVPIDRQRVSHMFHYFKRQCAYGEEESIRGWYKEFDHRRAKEDVNATVDAVESLASLNRMLDEGINDMILDHFTVRHPTSKGLKLGQLFYPDYGFAQQGVCELERDEHDIGRESLAMTMQKMRAHVTRAGSDVRSSLVLHGPGGTGKTMLIEALARTCDLPLVEVTPSDLAKSGEANVEGRARAVFDALAMLSRVVILFDEFDPILKRRDESGEKETNFYTFVTPGMLPKLKGLQESAVERRFVYALITNLVGTLDLPAIRKGRFDEVVGVYPPDPLSRAGYFARIAGMFADSHQWDKAKFTPECLMEVVARTSSIGMTAATAAGMFRANDPGDLKERPIGYIYGLAKAPWKPDFLPEDEFRGIRGVGRFAELECLQWGMLTEWDEQIANFPTSEAWGKAADRNTLWGQLLHWPAEAQGGDAIDRIYNRMEAELKKAKGAGEVRGGDVAPPKQPEGGENAANAPGGLEGKSGK